MPKKNISTTASTESFQNIANLVEKTSKRSLTVLRDQITSPDNTLVILPAVYDHYRVDVFFESKVPFTFALRFNTESPYEVVGAEPTTHYITTTPMELTATNLQKQLVNTLGQRPGLSATRLETQYQIDAMRLYAENHDDRDNFLRDRLASAIQKDLGFGPSVIDSWTLDWAKDDIIDFCFDIKGINRQNPLFSLHLLLSFDPEDGSWSVYTQYSDNRDEHIYVNAGDISPNPVDRLADLRDYLEHVVELGNKRYAEAQNRLANEE